MGDQVVERQGPDLSAPFECHGNGLDFTFRVMGELFQNQAEEKDVQT